MFLVGVTLLVVAVASWVALILGSIPQANVEVDEPPWDKQLHGLLGHC